MFSRCSIRELFNPRTFQQCFRQWIDSLSFLTDEQKAEHRKLIAIDGKALRRSHDRKKRLGAGCQKNITQQIFEGGGDYLLALRKNHPTLYELRSMKRYSLSSWTNCKTNLSIAR